MSDKYEEIRKRRQLPEYKRRVDELEDLEFLSQDFRIIQDVFLSVLTVKQLDFKAFLQGGDQFLTEQEKLSRIKAENKFKTVLQLDDFCSQLKKVLENGKI